MSECVRPYTLLLLLLLAIPSLVTVDPKRQPVSKVDYRCTIMALKKSVRLSNKREREPSEIPSWRPWGNRTTITVQLLLLLLKITSHSQREIFSKARTSHHHYYAKRYKKQRENGTTFSRIGNDPHRSNLSLLRHELCVCVCVCQCFSLAQTKQGAKVDLSHTEISFPFETPNIFWQLRNGFKSPFNVRKMFENVVPTRRYF